MLPEEETETFCSIFLLLHQYPLLTHSQPPSLPSFPFDLQPHIVEYLSSLSTDVWMEMARMSQEEMNDPNVDAFMSSPPEHIIASFKNAITYFRSHPISS